VYDLPDEISVRAEGALRIVTLNRPEALNAVNDSLHTGLALLWPRLSADAGARAAVLTGAGTAFSAGGDFGYLAELRRDQALRARTLAHGRDIVLGMARCRVPVVAAVNGPAVGLGCSLVALSDVVYLAETAFLADPHVQVGLVAADGGPLTWPLHTSLLLAKEYALTGARIPAERAVAMGLANHVVADPLAEATACAQRIAGLPQQAVESTKRLLNLHLERAVLATLDFAISAEDRTFDSPDLAAVLAAHEARKGGAA
jgi:enoyl-CoA hydratase/carnithine racemase